MSKQEIARMGGQAVHQKYGSEYMAELGKRGLEKALETTPDFHRKGGEASFRKQQVEAIRRGEFPNQPVTYWQKSSDNEIPF